MAQELPLSGYRIVDFGWVWAGTLLGSILGSYGAEVIKMESKRRIDGMRFGKVFELGEELEKNTFFHRFITELSENNTLVKTISELRSRVYRYRFVSVTIPGYLEKYASDHEKIIDAIGRKDSVRAREYVTEHVQFVKGVLVGFLREQKGL